MNLMPISILLKTGHTSGKCLNPDPTKQAVEMLFSRKKIDQQSIKVVERVAFGQHGRGTNVIKNYVIYV